MKIIETYQPVHKSWVPRCLIVDGEPRKLRKNPFHCCKEGVWMSRNGHEDWLRGCKPLFMWDCPESELEPVVPHHIGRGNEEYSTFELVMFYRRKDYKEKRVRFYMEAELKSREIAARFNS